MTDTSLAVDVSGPIGDALSGVVRFVPAFLLFLVIVLVGGLLAVVLQAGIAALLRGAGLHRVARGRLPAGPVAWAVIGLGAIAALYDIGVATPVLTAVLATVAGILVVGVGGGLIRPMRRRWEGWLDRLGRPAPARLPQDSAGPPSEAFNTAAYGLGDEPTVVVPMVRPEAPAAPPAVPEVPAPAPRPGGHDGSASVDVDEASPVDRG